MDSNLRVTCEVLTCCGTIMDCKSNFEAEDSSTSKKAAWITGIWRYLLWAVGLFNMVMDGIFIYKLWTTPGINKNYAYLMLSVTIASLLSEYVIFSPIINKLTANIRHWKDRTELLFFCSFAALISFWLEDLTTIYLYFRVDGVYDTEDLADVINLFSSVAAGLISGASMVLTACITFASVYGAFNENDSCFNRCCNCCRCVDTCTKMLDGPLGIVAIITIIGTAYGGYVAVKAIYLKDEVADGDEAPITDIFLGMMLAVSTLYLISFGTIRWKHSQLTNEEFRAKRDAWEEEMCEPHQSEVMERK